MKSFCDYLGLSNSCLYDVDDVIGRADRFGFQNFCSPGLKICICFFQNHEIIFYHFFCIFNVDIF